MVFCIDDAIIGGIISGASSIAGGYLSGKSSGQKETKLEKQKRKLLDDLMASVQGEGPYADLYKTDYDAFTKSYIDPAKSMFNNQIAPQIQQQYIASGQQRGTGLDDTLTRAGVDLDSMLNKAYFDYQENAKNRTQNALNASLGVGGGTPQGQSGSQAFGQATGGYLSSPAFNDLIGSIFPKQQTQRKGFENG